MRRAPPYNDAKRLSNALDAIRDARKAIDGKLASPAAEACMDDVDDALSLLAGKFTAAFDATVAEIERLEAAEVAA